MSNQVNHQMYSWKALSSEHKQEILKWITQSMLGLIGYGFVLFFCAGSLVWIWGWIFLLILALFMAAHPILLIPLNPELLVAREQGLRGSGVKTWDRWLVILGAGIFPIISWIVAALDYRFSWSHGLPLLVHLVGMLFTALGFGLFLWAMVSNAYFEEGVRIQDDRGHQVATSGPYQVIRHPGYAGAILAQLATPLLLGSWWAIPFALVTGIVYVIRTLLEDKTLILELPGYVEYTHQTRYRLIPGVW